MNKEPEDIIAADLGITSDELALLTFQADTETSDDGAPYYDYLRFTADNPPEVMAKIKDLDGDTVRLGPGYFAKLQLDHGPE